MTEREAFEKWLKDERPFSSIERGVGADGEPNCGDYERWPIEMAWQGWQAARAQPAGVPEGWVLVPREPTREMLAAACADGRDHPALKFTRPEERGGAIPLLPVAFYRAMISAAPPHPSEEG